jgi:hypothetical protein
VPAPFVLAFMPLAAEEDSPFVIAIVQDERLLEDRLLMSALLQLWLRDAFGTRQHLEWKNYRDGSYAVF